MEFIISRIRLKGSRSPLKKAGYLRFDSSSGHIVLSFKQHGRTKEHDYRDDSKELFLSLKKTIEESEKYELSDR